MNSKASDHFANAAERYLNFIKWDKKSFSRGSGLITICNSELMLSELTSIYFSPAIANKLKGLLWFGGFTG